jgi:hypothetical protein
VAATWQVPDVQARLLRDNGRPVPPPVSGYLLLDTGASKTCISSAVAQALGLTPIGKIKAYGASGEHTNRVVSAQLGIEVEDDRGNPRRISWVIPCQAIPRLEEPYQHIQLADSPLVLVGLLGRDLLRHATVIYDGKTGVLHITFDRHSTPAQAKKSKP